MKNILYLKTSPATNVDFKQSHWFGMKYLISKLPSNAYTDSSFDKEITKDKIKKKRLCQLMTMHSAAEANLNNAIVQLAEVSVKKLQDKIINQYNEAIEKEKHAMNEAAIKIQASIRGYLVRKKYEDTLICLSRKKFSKILISLKETEKYCFLNVGIMIHNAARKIQTSVKKALFRMKIHRISDAYEAHMEKLREPLYKRLATMLLCYTCRDRVKEKIWYRMTLRKLKKIREKLAILKIKYIFKKKKLTMKNIRFKIRKYKRMLRFSHQNTLVRGGTFDDKRQNLDFLLTQKLSNMLHQLPIGHPVVSNHASAPGNENKNSSSGVPTSSHNQDHYLQHHDNQGSKALSNGEGSQGEFSLVNNKDHNDETIHSNAEAPSPSVSKRKKKIMLLSVGVRKVKENTIVPILFQKELDSRLENHHIVGTAASIIRMTETKPSRFSPKIRSPEKIRVKSANCRNHTPLTYHYLNDTACSRLKFEPTRSPSPVSDETPPRRHRRGSPYKTHTFKRICKDSEQNHGKKIIRQFKISASRKKEAIVPTAENGSFKIRADVKISKASRVQTPKSTKSVSIRRTSAPLVRRNSEFSPVTLTFEAALPQYSELLTSLIRPIYSRFRPKTCHKISR